MDVDREQSIPDAAEAPPSHESVVRLVPSPRTRVALATAAAQALLTLVASSQVEFAEDFSVTYYNHYKHARNLRTNEDFVLYQVRVGCTPTHPGTPHLTTVY